MQLIHCAIDSFRPLQSVPKEITTAIRKWENAWFAIDVDLQTFIYTGSSGNATLASLDGGI